MNHLIHEKSPYLLQHVDNPVDWFPWGDEAFQKAAAEDRPIFLSIGYATCHWCHVMAHESFEDEEVAGLLNGSFVSIKVDREERPDIDQIYMSFCQALTGQGGWPLSIFMTPERKPFFAGTYFPKDSRMGLTGFGDLLRQVTRLWREDRESILHSSEKILQAFQKESVLAPSGPPLGRETLEKCYARLGSGFDPVWGGFGRAPKFPMPHQLTFLLRWHRRSRDPKARQMVEKTLESMRGGGIFDQIGFGFHRYSVDDRWLVPHFEKMLYDQALLAIAYTEAYQAFRNGAFARTAGEVFTYVLRDMTAPEGGFFSAEDADSEGEEGRFYVWTPREIRKHLGEEQGDLFCRFYGITPEGNFEGGASIPSAAADPEQFAAREHLDLQVLEETLNRGREKLFQVREKRVHPLKDDKIITSWNGLMIAALAKGFQALQEPAYLKAAGRAADFILEKMRSGQGRLRRRFRHGHIAHPGFLDDYAFLVWGLIELYEAGFEVRYLEEALHLNQVMLELFWDGEGNGFFYAGQESEALITRPKDLYDGAIPSGNSVAALNLLRLGRMTGNPNLEKKADQLRHAFSSSVNAYPMGYTQFLVFLDFLLGPGREIVIAGGPDREMTRKMTAVIQQAYLPNKVFLLKSEGEAGRKLGGLCPFADALHPLRDKTTVYLCEGFACRTPLTDIESLRTALE